jgi:hypothetical protein
VSKPTRLSRAIEIRDHVLPLVRARGAPQRFQVGQDFVSATQWEHAVFTFGLWVPNKMPLRSPIDYAMAVVLRDAVEHALPFGLDIWRGVTGKVLSMDWADDGRVNLISIRPGPWESEVLALE